MEVTPSDVRLAIEDIKAFLSREPIKYNEVDNGPIQKPSQTRIGGEPSFLASAILRYARLNGWALDGNSLPLTRLATLTFKRDRLTLKTTPGISSTLFEVSLSQELASTSPIPLSDMISDREAIETAAKRPETLCMNGWIETKTIEKLNLEEIVSIIRDMAYCIDQIGKPFDFTERTSMAAGFFRRHNCGSDKEMFESLFLNFLGSKNGERFIKESYRIESAILDIRSSAMKVILTELSNKDRNARILAENQAIVTSTTIALTELGALLAVLSKSLPFFVIRNAATAKALSSVREQKK